MSIVLDLEFAETRKILDAMTPLNLEDFVSNTRVRRSAKNKIIPGEIIEKKTGHINQRVDMAYVEEEACKKMHVVLTRGSLNTQSKFVTTIRKSSFTQMTSQNNRLKEIRM